MGALRVPSNGKLPESREQTVKRVTILSLLLPIIILTSSWGVSRLDLILARMHPKVRLAEQIQKEDAGLAHITTLESRTFRTMGTPTQELFDQAKSIRSIFRTGGWWLGGFLGLVFALKLIKLSVMRSRTDYEPDRTSCFSCARCFDYCPNEHVIIENLNNYQLLDIERHAN